MVDSGDFPPLPSSPDELRREHQLTRLMALSFDSAASPSITLRALSTPELRDASYGWGFSWYPDPSRAALVVKDPSSIGENAMTKVLREWERFQSTVFVCHLRGAARTLKEQDTQPFSRSFGGRDWVFAHNGDITGDFETALPLPPDGAFDPIGRTDSERVFCWLLERARSVGAKQLADIGWERLLGWLRELDVQGTANFLLTDGTDIVAYHDDERYNGLHWTRLVPPHETELRADDIVVDLVDASDRLRTVLAFSTVPMAGAEWRALEGGQMLVVRRGSIVFDSLGEEAGTPRVVVPDAQTPPLRSVPPNMISTAPVVSVPPSYPPAVPYSLPSAVDTGGDSAVLSVLHETVYRYTNHVERSTHLYRLRPVSDRLQEVLSHDVSIGIEALRREFEDVFGNVTTRTEVEKPYSEHRILARSLVRVRAPSVHNLISPERRISLPLVWMPWQRQMMMPYLLPPELPESQLAALYEYALSFVKRQDSDLIQTLLDINNTIYRDYKYQGGTTTLSTTAFDVYVGRTGVCQDFANLFICLARLLSIPARYRVGYIWTRADHANQIQSQASHAWAELYLPWHGWIGFDPTNGCLAGLDHVRVAAGRNYVDATPTSGTVYTGGGMETLTVDVRVESSRAIQAAPGAV